MVNQGLILLTVAQKHLSKHFYKSCTPDVASVLSLTYCRETLNSLSFVPLLLQSFSPSSPNTKRAIQTIDVLLKCWQWHDQGLGSAQLLLAIEVIPPHHATGHRPFSLVL